jgi:hypothetical protein
MNHDALPIRRPHALYEVTKDGREILVTWGAITDEDTDRHLERPEVLLCFEDDDEESDLVHQLSLSTARDLARMILAITEEADEQAEPVGYVGEGS